VTTLPVPLFHNINIKKNEIEVFYSIKDSYAIEQTDDGIAEPKFGWLNDVYLKKVAYVDVILSIQIGDVIEDLTRRVHLDTSVKSFISLRDQALSRRKRSNLEIMYKATFNLFDYWENMPISAENMLQLLERTSDTNMSVTIRTGLDRGAYMRMRDLPFAGDILTSENTKDIIVASKIKNYTRTSVDEEPVIDRLITDEIIFDRISQQLRDSRIFRSPSTIKSVNSDNIYDKKRTFKSFFSPLFLSEDGSDKVRGMFFFDHQKFIEKYKDGEPKEGVKNTAYVCHVKVTRNRVQVTEGNSDFSNDKAFRKFDDSALPEVVMDTMLPSKTAWRNVRGITTEQGRRHAFCFRDSDASKRKSGKYKYEVEISVKDDTAKYFVEKLRTLRSQLQVFEKYISFSEVANNAIDPSTGLFSEPFSRAAKYWWKATSPSIQPPWRTVPQAVVRVLQDDSPVLNIDMSHYIISLLRICHPSTGNDKGVRLMKLILERAISFYEDRLAPYGRNQSSPRQGQTNKSLPSSGAGDYEKVTKFSYTFREYIDRDERKNLRAKYFDRSVKDTSSCLMEISSKNYKKVVDKNLLSILGKGKQLPSEITIGGKTVFAGVNSEINDTSMSFLTPNSFRMGNERYVAGDFLEPPDQSRDEETADRRAQIYEDTVSADNTSVAESFMIKYGVSLIPLSTPDTSIRPRPRVNPFRAGVPISPEDAIDDDDDAQTSRQTMVGLVGSLVDGENSEILLENPIMEVSILSTGAQVVGDPKVAVINFAGDNKSLTKEDFDALPVHIKCVLIYLSKTDTTFSLDTSSYIKMMADNFESDANDSYDARFFYELFFKQIQRVQFLSGFQMNNEKKYEYQAPIFKDFNKKNLVRIPDGKMLCRIVPYENATMSYDARKGINGEPIEKYFVLDYRASTFRGGAL